MEHPKKEDFTYKKIFELTSKFPQDILPHLKIEIENIEELCKKFIIVDGEWKLITKGS
ncbi:MAG: hypothetical protein H0U73_01520 [Tatlockia sp.]|nr:hypothetical protein [Tatlockia sp.]